MPKRLAIKCVDHLGNEYPSLSKMCKRYGIRVDTYTRRLERGFSVCDALTIPAVHSIEIMDHLGKKYPSIKCMCYSYGIDPKTYKNRLKKGWEFERILTTPIHKKGMQ